MIQDMAILDISELDIKRGLPLFQAFSCLVQRHLIPNDAIFTSQSVLLKLNDSSYKIFDDT